MESKNSKDSNNPKPNQQRIKLRNDEFKCLKAAKRLIREEFTKAKHKTLRWWNNRFWKSNVKHYERIEDPQLTADVLSWLDTIVEDPRPRQAEETVKCLRSVVGLGQSFILNSWISDGRKGTILSLENGLLDIDAYLAGESDVLQPHSPDFFCLNSTDYDYNPNAKCPEFDKALELYFQNDQDRKALLVEWMGLCLIPDTSFNKCLVLVGEGGNGKSVILDVLQNLVGKDNCSSVPLEQLGNRFQLFNTHGKLVNIASDVGRLDQSAEGIFKQFTSGDLMQFEEKHKPAFTARPTARMTLAANELPSIKDKSSGIHDRLLILPFEFQIPEENQDLRFKDSGRDDWVFRKELPGILNKALEGLKRLKSRGKFKTPEKSKIASEEYKNQNSPARLFFSEYVEHSESGQVLVGEFYDCYKNWANKNGYLPLNNSAFGKELKRIFRSVEKERPGTGKSRKTFYKGIQFKNKGKENE